MNHHHRLSSLCLSVPSLYLSSSSNKTTFFSVSFPIKPKRPPPIKISRRERQETKLKNQADQAKMSSVDQAKKEAVIIFNACEKLINLVEKANQKVEKANQNAQKGRGHYGEKLSKETNEERQETRLKKQAGQAKMGSVDLAKNEAVIIFKAVEKLTNLVEKANQANQNAQKGRGQAQ